MARALVHDHGMDYSEAEMRRALAWMILQHRDMALHLRLWLLHRSGPDHKPHRVLEDLLNHLLSIEDAWFSRPQNSPFHDHGQGLMHPRWTGGGSVGPPEPDES